MKKRMMTIALCGVMAVSMFGCGKDEKKPAAKDETETTTVVDDTTEKDEEETTTAKEEDNNVAEKEEEETTTKKPVETEPVEYEIIQKNCYYYIGGDEYDYENTLSAGDVMPLQAQDGDVYETPDYIYTYIESKADGYPSGWDVTITNSSQYGEIRDVIASEPVVYMLATFMDVDDMVEAPTIPNTVEYMIATFAGANGLETVPNLPKNLVEMTGAFYECDKLTTVPEIPSGVECMDIAFYRSGIVNAPDIPSNVKTMVGTFGECSSLTGEIVFNANPEEYIGCFMYVDLVEQNISFAGSTSLEPELRASRNDGGYIDDLDVINYYYEVQSLIMYGEME